MPEFQVIRRTDVPRGQSTTERANKPSVRMHRSGVLYFSVMAMQALSDQQDCRVIVEFDPATRILKFTVPDKLPQGLTESDFFTVRTRKTKKSKRVQGLFSANALFHYIGLPCNQNKILPIVGVDPQHRSVSIRVPAEEPCDSSNGSAT